MFTGGQRWAATVRDLDYNVPNAISDTGDGQWSETESVGQIVDLVVRQVKVGETAELTDAVRKSLQFVLRNIQLHQSLQRSYLLTAHENR